MTDVAENQGVGYPPPKGGPDVPYSNAMKAQNPVLRGVALQIAAFLYVLDPCKVPC